LRVGFFTDRTRYFPQARAMVSSVRRHMPGVEIVQLTDGKCPAFPGVTVERIGGEMPLMRRRIEHYERLDGEWLFLDTDTLVRADVRDVFDRDFDIALADRGLTDKDDPRLHLYAKTMPWNIGVIFSRSRKFWRDVLVLMRELPTHWQEWEGEQVSTCEVAKGGKYKVEILSRYYNYTPDTPLEVADRALILHLKGKARKRWIPEYEEVAA
jgi:hypothetical protein